jgi:alpha-ketoglutarate-dependent 2,4-dichlorophenoxyacetate dioxygenase
VPPEGGNTEFATMRGAYDALTPDVKDKLEGLVAEHSLVYSRSVVTPQGALTGDMKSDLPGAWQVMVRENPVNHRKNIYAGAHASHVIGWSMEDGRAFIDWLNQFATQPQFCYSHRWRAGDLVIWDNRCVLHRATAYDTVRHKRLMQRTTVAGDAPTTVQPARYELAAE